MSSSLHICLDIDDTITYQPEFFSRLTHKFGEAKITIVTFRTGFESATKCLEDLNIRYDRLIVSSDKDCGRLETESLTQWKARVVNAMKPDLFFEDMPEVVTLVDDDVAVFQPCDNIIRSWMRTQLPNS